MIYILGSSLAAVLCAVRLQEAGCVVALIPEDGVPIGKHFRGWDVEDCVIDMGMVLLEPFPNRASLKALAKEELAPVDLETTKYVGAAYDWLSGYDFSQQGVLLETRWNAGNHRDFLVADDLAFLASADGQLTRTWVRELNESIKFLPEDWHPSNKRSVGFTRAPLAEYGPRVYGEHFWYDVLEPWVLSFGREALHVLASRHRDIWLPLYWPETIRDALLNPDTVNFGKKFTVPRHQSIGMLVRRLSSRVQTAKAADPTRAPIIDFRGGLRKTSKYFLEWRIGAAIVPQSLPDGVRNFNDRFSPAIRISTRNLGAHGSSVTIEARKDCSASEMARMLASNDYDVETRNLEVRNARLPVAARSENHPPNQDSEPWSPKVGSSFNDQLVGGIWAAERILSAG